MKRIYPTTANLQDIQYGYCRVYFRNNNRLELTAALRETVRPRSSA